LLTAVIERVTGQNYAQYVEANMFLPLHMIHSGTGLLPSSIALGYIHNAGESDWHEGRRAFTEFLTGFASIYSTVDDMLLWVHALNGNGLLSQSSRTAMLTDYGYNYGFGWRIGNKYGRKLFWHTGNNPGAGYASIIDQFPDDDLTIIVLTNNTGITASTATLMIEGKKTTFPANAARETVEEVENLYFTGNASN
jgi:CubicO group peptidase (beta-lactamase class C family)